MNKVILGAANFGNLYRGVKLSESECFEILEEFEKRGGEFVQTADDYGDSWFIIYKYIKNKDSNLKMIYKCNVDGSLWIDEKFNGHSIYYTKQLSEKDKIIIIPDCNIWDAYLPVMHLHSKVYVRSYYTIPEKYHITNREFIDGFIVGVENKNQLVENMERFNV